MQMGSEAVQMLVNMIEHGKAAEQRWAETGFVVRKSTRPLGE
jgi:DNA-binding LacI/PurR family transcriptional regulator